MDVSMIFDCPIDLAYILIGTYKTVVKTIEFTNDSLKLTNICPNSLETKFKYHVSIPFIEIQELLYCLDPNLPIIFVKPNAESNNKIQDCLDLGINSTNGLRFNINSNDPREHYIIVVFNEKIDEKLVKQLKHFSQLNNKDCKCEPIGADKLIELITQTQNSKGVINRPNNSVINNTSHTALYVPLMSRRLINSTTIKTEITDDSVPPYQ